MKTNLWIKTALGTLLLTVIYTFLNIFFSASEVTQGTQALLWGTCANFLIALLLGYYILNSTLSGIKLSLSVFLIYFLIGHFNILIEAYIFNVTDREQTLFELLRGLLATAIFSPLYIFIFRKKHNQE